MELLRKTMSPRPVRRRAARRTAARTVAGLWVLALLVVLAACGSSPSSDSSGGGSTEAVTSDRGVVAGTTDSGVAKDAGHPVQTRAVIMTGQVSLKSKSLTTVRSGIDDLVARYGGYVDRENTVDDGGGRVSSSTIELRIPSQSFEAVMGALKDIATVTSTNTRSEDVTTEVIDVEARVRTAEVSLRRLRAFLGRATNVDAVIRLESEISQREADLASLLAQQRYLKNQTSLATITVTMTRTTTPNGDDPLDHAGFLTGLRKGWSAFLDLAVVAATAAGALLPFALALAVVLVPLTLLLRAHRRSRLTPAAAPQPVTPPAGPS